MWDISCSQVGRHSVVRAGQWNVGRHEDDRKPFVANTPVSRGPVQSITPSGNTGKYNVDLRSEGTPSLPSPLGVLVLGRVGMLSTILQPPSFALRIKKSKILLRFRLRPVAEHHNYIHRPSFIQAVRTRDFSDRVRPSGNREGMLGALLAKPFVLYHETERKLSASKLSAFHV